MIAMIKFIKKILTNKFNIKNLGVVDVMLRMRFFLRYLMDCYCLNLIMLRKFLINIIKVTITW
jgi:hypothetical protein